MSTDLDRILYSECSVWRRSLRGNNILIFKFFVASDIQRLGHGVIIIVSIPRLRVMSGTIECNDWYCFTKTLFLVKLTKWGGETRFVKRASFRKNKLCELRSVERKIARFVDRVRSCWARNIRCENPLGKQNVNYI